MCNQDNRICFDPFPAVQNILRCKAILRVSLLLCRTLTDNHIHDYHITFMLLIQERKELTKQFSNRSNYQEASIQEENEEPVPEVPSDETTLSRFMPTSRRIVQFSESIPAGPNARVVYIDGAFDMFHPGHVEILKVVTDPLILYQSLTLSIRTLCFIVCKDAINFSKNPQAAFADCD